MLPIPRSLLLFLLLWALFFPIFGENIRGDAAVNMEDKHMAGGVSPLGIGVDYKKHKHKMYYPHPEMIAEAEEDPELLALMMDSDDTQFLE